LNNNNNNFQEENNNLTSEKINTDIDMDFMLLRKTNLENHDASILKQNDASKKIAKINVMPTKRISNYTLF